MGGWEYGVGDEAGGGDIYDSQSNASKLASVEVQAYSSVQCWTCGVLHKP